jgi:hypothetical protein
MIYSLLLYSNEANFAKMTPAQMGPVMAAFQAYAQALKDAGVFVAADWLQPTRTATTITLKDGARRVQDGPCAETKEQLGGFYLINVPDLDTALQWAERCPAVHGGTIEVRPSAMGR